MTSTMLEQVCCLKLLSKCGSCQNLYLISFCQSACRLSLWVNTLSSWRLSQARVRCYQELSWCCSKTPQEHVLKSDNILTYKSAPMYFKFRLQIAEAQQQLQSRRYVGSELAITAHLGHSLSGLFGSLTDQLIMHMQTVTMVHQTLLVRYRPAQQEMYNTNISLETTSFRQSNLAPQTWTLAPQCT